MSQELIKRISPTSRFQQVQVLPLLLFALVLAGCATNTDRFAPSGTVATHKLVLPHAVPYIRQSTGGTCWLACAAMIYGYYGVNVTEEQLDAGVKSITGTDRNGQLEATKRECLIALAQKEGWHEQLRKAMAHIIDFKQSSTRITADPAAMIWDAVEAQVVLKDTDNLLMAIIAKEPAVIICTLDPQTDDEHAMVVTAVSLKKLDEPVRKHWLIVSVDVLDPATDNIRVLESTYLKSNLKAIYTKSTATKILEDELAAFKVQSN